MLDIVKDDKDHIVGACEWFIVDSSGRIDDKGEYVFIGEMEINPDARNNGVIREFVRLIISKAPNCNYGYFHRLSKYPNRPVKVYTRKMWLSLIKQGES